MPENEKTTLHTIIITVEADIETYRIPEILRQLIEYVYVRVGKYPSNIQGLTTYKPTTIYKEYKDGRETT